MAARSRGKLGAAPTGVPVLPVNGCRRGEPGQEEGGPGALAGTVAVQTWARAGMAPARRGREGRTSSRRGGGSRTGTGGAGRGGGGARGASPRGGDSDA